MGMEFLAKNGIIHGDLATRNILLSCELVAKLSDFGLSGKLPMGKQSIELTTTKCPIRWMAPESFKQRILTKATDIWSYGVVLWEIFALADRPYEGMFLLQIPYDFICIQKDCFFPKEMVMRSKLENVWPILLRGCMTFCRMAIV